jgi:hypothetical protein
VKTEAQIARDGSAVTAPSGLPRARCIGQALKRHEDLAT